MIQWGMTADLQPTVMMLVEIQEVKSLEAGVEELSTAHSLFTGHSLRHTAQSAGGHDWLNIKPSTLKHCRKSLSYFLHNIPWKHG